MRLAHGKGHPPLTQQRRKQPQSVVADRQIALLTCQQHAHPIGLGLSVDGLDPGAVAGVANGNLRRSQKSIHVGQHALVPRLNEFQVDVGVHRREGGTNGVSSA